jgi:Ni/Co efflux regulator RcnB
MPLFVKHSAVPRNRLASFRNDHFSHGLKRPREGLLFEEIFMSRLLISAAAVALCIGASAALAQTDTSTTRETTTTPAGTTQTTTHTETSSDGYATYRKTVTSTKRYDAGTFTAPSGYTYKKFAVGDHVSPMLLHGNVALTDFQTYQLVPPPEGALWIRDGNDALLVDTNTGEVIQAQYDLFS